MAESQVARMEKELKALRNLFDDASSGEGDPSRMMSLSRVIIQIEKEIGKQRIQEGITLQKDKLIEMIDQFSNACVRVGQQVLPKELYDQFIDALMEELLSIWGEIDDS